MEQVTSTELMRRFFNNPTLDIFNTIDLRDSFESADSWERFLQVAARTVGVELLRVELRGI